MPDWETAAWPRAEHLQRVFHVKSASSLGTAFALDIDGRQYLVSALHVVEQAAETAALEVYVQGGWKQFWVDIIGVDFTADIAVFALKEAITRRGLQIETGSTGFVAGQEVFILGFPLGIVGIAVNPGFPIPLIKRGVVSLLMPGSPNSVYISASANPGFSGGPVYFANPKSGKATLMAIVLEELGYQAPVKDAQGVEIGTIFKDSNIVKCSFIDHALTVIANNPRGFDLSAAEGSAP
jgi:S1-C subfamily serine protease